MKKSPLKIAIFGYGRMGQLVEETARREGIIVGPILNSKNNAQSQGISASALDGVDVGIDFSTPGAVIGNIEAAAKLGLNLVVGTTGWYERLDEIKAIVARENIGFVFGSNFSLGVNLFFNLAEYASGLFSLFQDYDPFIEEAHHKFKKDAPSGTAITLRKILEKDYTNSIPVTSVRAGFIPGTHRLSFDSEVDTITLTHTARNRQGLAAGAIFAARWIAGKKGFYEFREIIAEHIRAAKGVSHVVNDDI